MNLTNNDRWYLILITKRLTNRRRTFSNDDYTFYIIRITFHSLERTITNNKIFKARLCLSVIQFLLVSVIPIIPILAWIDCNRICFLID